MRSAIIWTVVGAALGAIVTLLFVPMTKVIEYRLTGYLSKDFITIEQVDLQPDTTKLPFPEEEFRRLLETIPFQVYLSTIGESQDILRPKTYYRRYLVDQDVSSSGYRQDLIEKDVIEISNIIASFIKFNGEAGEIVKSYTKRLQEYKEGDKIEDMIAWVQSLDKVGAATVAAANVLTFFEPSKAIPALQQFIRTASIAIPIAHNRATEALNFLKEFRPRRTGTLVIGITLLNTGDTDGLLRQDGHLILVNENRKIPMRVLPSDYLPKIERKSMVQVFFKPNEGKATPDDIQLLKALVVSEASSPVRIEVSDIRDTPIHSKNFTLPVGSRK